MRSLVGDMAQAKATIEEIPERVRLALAPAADAMALVDERMSRLADTTIPLAEALPSPSPVPEPVSASGAQADRAEAEDPSSTDVVDPGAHGLHLDVATVLDEEHEEAIAAATETLSILAGSSDDGSYEPLEGFGSA